MISMQDYLEAVSFRITEGGDYGWNCYGHDAHTLSAWNGIHGKGGWSANIVFDTKTQVVYEVEVCDYTNERAYRIINPDDKVQHDLEGVSRGELGNQAWDGVDYVDLDVDEDFLEKLEAIINGVDYDTRVQVQVEFSDDELLKYMKLAHERDITFNQLIEEALRHAIEDAKRKGILKDYGQDLG